MRLLVEVAKVAPQVQFKIAGLADAVGKKFWKALFCTWPSKGCKEGVFGGLQLRGIGQACVVENCLAGTEGLLVEGQDATNKCRD